LDRASHSFPTRRSSDLDGGGGDDTEDPADPDGTDEDGAGGGSSDEADDTGNLPDTGSSGRVIAALSAIATLLTAAGVTVYVRRTDRKSTRLNSSHVSI